RCASGRQWSSDSARGTSRTPRLPHLCHSERAPKAAAGGTHGTCHPDRHSLSRSDPSPSRVPGPRLSRGRFSERRTRGQRGRVIADVSLAHRRAMRDRCERGWGVCPCSLMKPRYSYFPATGTGSRHSTASPGVIAAWDLSTTRQTSRGEAATAIRFSIGLRWKSARKRACWQFPAAPPRTSPPDGSERGLGDARRVLRGSSTRLLAFRRSPSSVETY